mmetsp:Transcript_26964/g.38237  ORF Transcript_26964/g.38237 Transcript_26964/m.38237 type:complete len:164 (-) Transcript_26964:270-761(-)|eukprot:CAMPEP_0202462890 /NCGR_PEP_ID=MMETSP1360-20130828/55890_1 /ASSEMBLY_ACC=CAM_ASM_000848 /TAXON_ID=515479 /ORGANISM="Licmophora paradoxa, Strain CCMP2313" /LENGTH=163 /DNA_ID=CAMNT_0049085551 /DNA_START=59 /DNA_END=550 /DNA_ORIENTATION=-
MSHVANKMVNGKQMTVSWHVDDLKPSHEDSKAVDGSIRWVENTYGLIGNLKVVRGKIHNYLGMTLDNSMKRRVSVNMTSYVKSMVDNFPAEETSVGKVPTPWNENFFKVQENSPTLPVQQAEMFHTVTAQGLFLCKRARPDISPAIAFESGSQMRLTGGNLFG